MRYILIIVLICRTFGLDVQAAESPFGTQSRAVFEARTPHVSTTVEGGYVPFSNGKNTSPILRAGDPDDNGDQMNNTGGTDGTEDVNDNKIPTGDGMLFMALLPLSYVIIFTLVRKKQITTKY